MRRSVLSCCSSLDVALDRLLQLPRPLLGPRRRGRGGRRRQLPAQRLATWWPVPRGRPARHPGDGELRHRHLGGLRAVRAGGGAQQAAGGFGQRRRSGVARAGGAQGHPLPRHPDGPPGHDVTTAPPTASTAPTCGCCSTSCSARPTRCRAVKDGDPEEGGGDPGPAQGRRLRPAGLESSRRIRAARPIAATCRPVPKGRFVASLRQRGVGARSRGRPAAWWKRRSGFTSSSGPPLAEVRDRLDDYLLEHAGAALDSIYMDSLADGQQDQDGERAPPRRCVPRWERPRSPAAPSKTLTTYKGGELTVQRVPPLGAGAAAAVRPPAQGGERQHAAPVRPGADPEHPAPARGRCRGYPARPTRVEDHWSGATCSQLDTLQTEMGLTGGGPDRHDGVGGRAREGGRPQDRAVLRPV